MQRRAPPPVNRNAPDNHRSGIVQQLPTLPADTIGAAAAFQTADTNRLIDILGKPSAVRLAHFNGQFNGNILQRDAEIVTQSCSEKACQAQYPAVPHTVDPKHRRPLAKFLRLMEDAVMEQLELNMICDTEKNYDVELEFKTDSLDFLASLDRNHLSVQCCTSLCWNSAGSLLAASFGEKGHDTFCDHKGGVIVSKTNRITMKSELRSYITCETDTCISSTAFHPRRPNLLAAAGCNGQIFLWDIVAATPATANLIGASGMRIAGGHSELISCIRWIPMDIKKRTFMILTGACDGRLMTWINQTAQKQSSSTAVANIVPRRHTTVESGAIQTHNQENTGNCGVSSLSTQSQTDDGYCIVGTDTGAVLLCNTQRFTDAKLPITVTATALNFVRHLGPVTCVTFSPFSTKCFATTSLDGRLKIFQTTTSRPLLEVAILEQPTSCAWSPFRPFVLAVGTITGTILFFDFISLNGRSAPVKKAAISENQEEISCLAFNIKDEELLAVGGKNGVQLWKVPDALAKPIFDEIKDFQSFIQSEY